MPTRPTLCRRDHRCRGATVSRRDVLAACIGSGIVLLDAEGGTDDEFSCLEVDLSDIPPGKSVTVMWQNRRVFIRHRTKAEIRAAREAVLAELVDPATDEARAKQPEWIVVIGECTHAGCKPIEGLGGYGGWLCLCHGSDFDTAGRVRKGPALENLQIPPHEFTGPLRLRIGQRC